MIDADKAQAFAREWVKAWNDHDLEAILSHYAEDVVFHSPRIRMVTGKDVDSVVLLDSLHTGYGLLGCGAGPVAQSLFRDRPGSAGVGCGDHSLHE